MTTPAGAIEVARMAWPLALGLLSFTLMGVVDTLLMGKVSTTAQAGVAVASMTVVVFLSFFRGLASGAQALVAAADGAKDEARLQEAAGAGLVMAGAFGVAAALGVGLGIAPHLEGMLGTPEVASSARRYLVIRAWAVPLSVLALGLLAGLQGRGDTRAHMVVSVVGNVVNAVVGAALVFGLGPLPALAEAGAAWGTVAGAAVMAAMYLVRFSRTVGAWVRPRLEVLKSALSVGAPAGAQNLLGVGSMFVMNVALARTGETELAASQIVLQIASVSFLPGAGIGEAGGVLVGRYLGAGQPAHAARAIGSARWLALGVMAACGLVFLLEGARLASLFSADPAVVQLASVLLLFAASFQVFDAVAMVHICALRAAGDTRFTLAVTAVSAWGLQVPCTLLLGLYSGWGARGAWLGITLEVLAVAALTLPRVARLRAGGVARLDLLLGRTG